MFACMCISTVALWIFRRYTLRIKGKRINCGHLRKDKRDVHRAGTTIDSIDKRLTKYRPDLSSERAPYRDKTVTLKKNLWSKVPDWA
jgi:hypothetical protein